MLLGIISVNVAQHIFVFTHTRLPTKPLVSFFIFSYQLTFNWKIETYNWNHLKTMKTWGIDISKKLTGHKILWMLQFSCNLFTY